MEGRAPSRPIIVYGHDRAWPSIIKSQYPNRENVVIPNEREESSKIIKISRSLRFLEMTLKDMLL